ncbi:MAG: PAS domain S-box protein [Calditrichaeota bacterium]|nr:PAS domain S-box protein [Calditrichota bacterium]
MKKKVKIIYLEDELKDVELVEAQFFSERFPFALTHVENKSELLAGLKKNEYDIILMDYSLPAFDPFKTITELKKSYPDTPIVIISGTIGEELAIETLKSGAIDYVLKHRLARLTPAIERALQLVEERQKRRLAQEKLRISEEKYRLLAENASDIISKCTRLGEYLYVSPSAKEITGYQAHELFGKICYDFVHPDDLNDVKNSHQSVLEKDVISSVEYRFRCKDGSFTWVETKSKQLKPNSDSAEFSILSVTRDIRERKAFEEQLKASLREKELLLNEIHHRVKNNLQIISSLLNLQAARIDQPEAKDVFRKSVSRIRTLALIHEKLYKSDNLAEIKFVDYAKSLARGLFLAYHSPESPVSLVVEGGDARLGIDKAIPSGLLINELVTNSLKYAFPDKRGGTILIRFEDLGESYSLTVADDGVGLPENFPLEETMGSRLLRALTDQLEGKMDIDRSQGAKFVVTFPKKFQR